MRNISMMSDSTRVADLRTKFLQDAAKLMATTSPSTASYFASESIQLQLANGQQNAPFEDQQRQTFCTACGNVFIPGWNCSIVRGDKTKGSGFDARNVVRRSAVVDNCHACHHRTTLSLPSPERPGKIGGKKHDLPSTTLPVEGGRRGSCAATAVTTKSSSKKRAKARKDNAGLHSLLKNSREAHDATTSPQLSLMDLMMP